MTCICGLDGGEGLSAIIPGGMTSRKGQLLDASTGEIYQVLEVFVFSVNFIQYEFWSPVSSCEFWQESGQYGFRVSAQICHFKQGM